MTHNQNQPKSRLEKTFAHLLAAGIAAGLTFTDGTNAQVAVDLNTWTAESYPAVSGFGPGNWNVASGGASVTQTVNGQPTMFYSDFSVFGTSLQGQITVTGGGDDDYIGFVLGFQPGDATNPNADYLLVDWKAGTQNFDFGVPSCTPGTTAQRGLAVSRVTGIPTADEFWGHTDFDATCSPLGDGLQELARGSNLGNTGWSVNTTYDFQFVFDANRLQVFVDNVLEMDINGSFMNGRMGFYNFSQASVNYNAFTLQCPASWQNYGTGWPGMMGVPSLTLDANPVLGTNVNVMLGNAAGTDTCGCIAFGNSQTNIATALGGTRLTSLELVLSVDPLPTVGSAVALAIPNDTSLCGNVWYGQLYHLDPSASAGVAFSQGIQIGFGQ